MAWIIGTDEAGYGPNLGPLLIAVTAWEVPDDRVHDDLFAMLADVVTREPPARAASSVARGNTVASANDRSPGAGSHDLPSADGQPCSNGSLRLRIADSKDVYQAGGSLEELETAVLVGLGLLGRRPGCWYELFETLAPDDLSQVKALPWYEGYQGACPVAVGAAVIERHVARLSAKLAQHQVRLAAMRARVITTPVFNRSLEQWGSKGRMLSAATLELVRWACEQAADQRCRIVCDKHGGRNRYHALIQEHLTDEFVWVTRESQAESCYRWGAGHEIAFRVGGEWHLPAGMASMIAKYLREQAMRAWNAYWLSRRADLRPTAGYPGDAKRFYREIEPLLGRIGLDKIRVWRNR